MITKKEQSNYKERTRAENGIGNGDVNKGNERVNK